MREVFAEIENWRGAGKNVAIATNVRKEGSSLRPLGAKMAVTTDYEIAGSVTGGCVEGMVYEEARNVMRNGTPKLLHYGVVGEENPWEVGLSCGGSLEVFVESLDSPAWREIYPTLKLVVEHGQLAAVATVISGEGLGNKMLVFPDERMIGGLGSERLDNEVKSWMVGQMLVQESGWKAFEDVEVFVDVFAPTSRLVIIGAAHIAIPLVTLGKALGFHTIVIDPREAFATRERFPHVDELITDWPSEALEELSPDEGTFIAALSHDEKLDNPALAVALKSPARYVGVLGTRKKLPQRFTALRELGVTDEQMARLRAPVGMNVGAVLPDEIALSILAEMVSAKHGRLENRTS